MSWLRLDDGFTKHPKFAGWTVGQKWALLELLEYCARYNTDGRIPTDLTLLPRSSTPALLRRACASGWLMKGPDGAFEVNDWDVYNPPRKSVEEAVFEHLISHPEASANDVCKAVKGSRKRILNAFARFQSGSESGSESVPNEDTGGTEVVTRAGAQARVRSRPVPSLEEQPPPTHPVEELPADEPAERSGGRQGDQDWVINPDLLRDVPA